MASIAGKSPTLPTLSVIECDTCWKSTGFRCLGKRQAQPAVTYEYEDRGYKLCGDRSKVPVRPSGCGALLVPTEEKWDGKWVVIRCPLDDSHARIALPCSQACSGNKFVDMNFVEREELRESVSEVMRNLPEAGDDSPALTCTKCGNTVDGVLCANHSPPKPVPRNGFYERVWCSYVWTCSNACGQTDKLRSGGMICRFHCMHCDSGSDFIDYEERNGPPVN